MMDLMPCVPYSDLQPSYLSWVCWVLLMQFLLVSA